jgi:hypothetical protein
MNLVLLKEFHYFLTDLYEIRHIKFPRNATEQL